MQKMQELIETSQAMQDWMENKRKEFDNLVES